MRCPKCGYNSFDYLDSCKKCGKDLVEFKDRYSIRSVLFPGQMRPTVAGAAEAVAESSAADAAVAAAATAATAAAAVATAGAAAEEVADMDDFTEATETAGSEADDFGFDFMGDSAEEEDLSFDELFEDAPADEDVEETLPSPEEEAAAAATESADDPAAPADFAFADEAEADDDEAAETELDSDFGFAVDTAETEQTAELESLDEGEPGDEPSEDAFELPPADEEESDFSPDQVDFEETDDEDGMGTKEDPKDPFELPESLQNEVAPEPVSEPVAADDVLPVTDQEPDLLLHAEEPLAADQLESQFFDSSAELSVEAVEESTLLEDLEESLPAAEAQLSAIPHPEEPEAPEKTAGTESPIAASEADSFAAGGEDSFAVPEEQIVAAGAAAVIATAASSAEEGLEPTIAVAGESLPEPDPSLPPLGGRVLAFACDLLLLVTVGFCFMVAAEMAMAEAGAGLFPTLETLVDLSVPYFLVLFFLAFGYFTLFHFLAGQTPGKMLARLRVETLEGEPLVFSQAFLRSVGGLLQLLPAGLGYLAILQSKERRGWNDRLAGTRLIRLNEQADEA